MNNRDTGYGIDSKIENTMTVEEIDEALARISRRLDSLASAPVAEGVVSSAAKGRIILSVAIMIVAALSLVLSSFAYFTATVYSSNNVIATGSTSVDFVDLNTPSGAGGSTGTELDPIKFMPGHVEFRKIYANNTGDTPLYLRASLAVEIELDERYATYANEVDTTLISFDINSDSWVLRDGYYYYSSALGSGKTSSELFDEIVFDPAMGNMYKNCTVRVTVLMEMVQASNNGDTPFDAVGWITDSEGGAP